MLEPTQFLNKNSGINWEARMQPRQPSNRHLAFVCFLCPWKCSEEQLFKSSAGDFEAPGSMSPWIVATLRLVSRSPVQVVATSYKSCELVARCTEDKHSALIGYMI